MAVKLSAVQSVKEAYDYAVGSYNYAKCSSNKWSYMALAKDIKEMVESGEYKWLSEMPDVGNFRAQIEHINGKCKAEAGATPAVPDTTTVGPAGPAGPGTAKSSFPWWIVLVLGGGAVAYYLYKQKGQ